MARENTTITDRISIREIAAVVDSDASLVSLAPELAGKHTASYAVAWDPERHGVWVTVRGWLCSCASTTLEVRWLRNRSSLVETHASAGGIPCFLPSPDGEAPVLNDRLELHSARTGSQPWNVRFAIEL